MQSIFTDNKHEPTASDLKTGLGSTYALWQMLVDFTCQLYSSAQLHWHYSGDKYGWGFRIKDKKRVLVYLLPRSGFFRVAMVFGQKGTDEILGSGVDERIKTELRNAKPYAEGRGIRIDVKDKALIEDLKRLIAVKISN